MFKWIPPLFVQIYLLFILSLGFGGIIAYLTNVGNLKKNEEVILRQISFFAQNALLELVHGEPEHLEDAIKEFNYTLESKIPQNAVFLLEINDDFAEMKIFKSQQNYGFSLEYLGATFIAQKDFSQELAIGDDLNIWVVLDFLTLLLTFALLLALLHPLKILQTALEEFTKGNYKFKIPLPNEPQLKRVAQSFETMRIKISKLMQTREFVLRNIGHELKTPISKAKLALELMEENPQKELLSKCIQNLDDLTSQILTFEKIQEGKDLLTIENFNVETLLLKALESLMLEEDLLEIQILNNFQINGDLQFLSIAVKNLIQNAKKYSTQGKITILATSTNGANTLCIRNFGTPLKHAITYYLEPFYRDETHKLIQGYGLGLGIVQGILELHNFALNYTYKDKQHNFILVLNKGI